MAYRRYSETSETNALLDFRSQVQGRGCVGVFEVAEVVQTPHLVLQNWGAREPAVTRVTCYVSQPDLQPRVADTNEQD